MDPKTIAAYATNATTYSTDWLSQPAPTDMYELLTNHFISGGVTADIGCGNGRDANWLGLKGFNVTGYDSSMELILEAKKLYPNIPFNIANLPKLKEINLQFENILCETVLMHLPKSQIIEAITNLKRIMADGGKMYLSWRVTEGSDLRHIDGRLYSAFESHFILDQFPKKSILHFEEKISVSSSGHVCRLIYQHRRQRPTQARE